MDVKIWSNFDCEFLNKIGIFQEEKALEREWEKFGVKTFCDQIAISYKEKCFWP